MVIMYQSQDQFFSGQLGLTMRYPAAETAEKHAKILQQAARLFRQRGFSGVSVAEIMQATGLTHGPFYNHFSSKEALIKESFEQRADETLTDFEHAAATPEGLLAYIENYLSTGHRDAPADGCLVAALGAEISREETVRPSLTRMVKTTLARYTSCFPWRTKKEHRGDAILISAAMLGAVILARAVDDEALSREILQEVLAGIQAQAKLPEAPR